MLCGPYTKKSGVPAYVNNCNDKVKMTEIPSTLAYTCFIRAKIIVKENDFNYKEK